MSNGNLKNSNLRNSDLRSSDLRSSDLKDRETSSLKYFVTGGTGFIGRHLVGQLLDRGGVVFCLVRENSQPKLEELRYRFGVDETRLIAVIGELTQAELGISAKDLARLHGIEHFFHLAGLHTQEALENHFEHIADKEWSAWQVNVLGTQQAVAWAEQMGVKQFHFMSTTKVAGDYDGIFREDMIGNLADIKNLFSRTKHEAELFVRNHCRIPYKIYRPATVVGDTKTGEIDRPTGPYQLFGVIKRIRDSLPPWVPLPSFDGGWLNLVPVDYVAQAVAHIAHQDIHKDIHKDNYKDNLPGKCFHITDTYNYRVGDGIRVFMRAARGPDMTISISGGVWAGLFHLFAKIIELVGPINHFYRMALKELGLSPEIVELIQSRTQFDNRDSQRILVNAGLFVPRLDEYAPQVWEYWEENLDPALFQNKSLGHFVENKTIVITGATSSLGRATALRLARAGARVVLVAEREEALKKLIDEINADIAILHSVRSAELVADSAVNANIKNPNIKSNGASQNPQQNLAAYFACDLQGLNYQAADPDASTQPHYNPYENETCRELIRRIKVEYGVVDFLINYAGYTERSLISDDSNKYGQSLHDYHIMMQLNYFVPVQLMRGLMPAMAVYGRGHVINVTTNGLMIYESSFAAYRSAQAALDGFTRSAALEYAEQGIDFTQVHIDLLRDSTTSIKTSRFSTERALRFIPVTSTEDAVEKISHAIIHKPRRVVDRLGVLINILDQLAPKIVDLLARTVFGAVQEQKLKPKHQSKQSAETVVSTKSQKKHTDSANTISANTTKQTDKPIKKVVGKNATNEVAEAREVSKAKVKKRTGRSLKNADVPEIEKAD